MLSATEFKALSDRAGKPVTFHQVKPPKAVVAVQKALVATLTKAPEGVINSFGVGGYSIQIAQAYLGALFPEKFDYVVDGNGFKYVAEHVVVHTARGSDEVVSYTLYSKGRVAA